MARCWHAGAVREEVRRFLDQEIARDFIRKAKVIYIAGVPAGCPPLFMPLYPMSGFRDVGPEDCERLREQCRESNLAMGEEEYLMGLYPDRLSEPAIRYVEEEKREIRDALKQETFGQWYGLKYGWSLYETPPSH